MRRKPGTLTPLEVIILGTAIDLALAGQAEVHGFLLAREMKARQGTLFRVAYGPLYKALGRMEEGGLFASRWEDPALAEAERRPRRCYYRVTAQGEQALKLARLASGTIAGLTPGEA